MILASSSPRRIELLREIGFDPRVIPADIDETPLPNESPKELVRRLAAAKAHHVLTTCKDIEPGETIIAADTVVWDGVECLGKPTDAADARRMLRSLSGRVHHVSTGVCCLVVLDARTASCKERLFVETTDVDLYPLCDEEIASYVATGEPLDKAGAYGIQGRGRLLVKGISGDYFNVVGLPIARLVRELDSLTALRASHKETH